MTALAVVHGGVGNAERAEAGSGGSAVGRIYLRGQLALTRSPRVKHRGDMADAELHTMLEGGAFFESPRWHDGRWWVSDFYCHLVLSVSASGEPREVLEVEEQPSGLGWMPDGSMLVVSMRDHRILRWS
ncbi:MAG: hypothetical protein ACXVHJ_36215, partial [Solirubrobacteraceae bacterium]